jgi:hypothetical protein
VDVQQTCDKGIHEHHVVTCHQIIGIGNKNYTIKELTNNNNTFKNERGIICMAFSVILLFIPSTGLLKAFGVSYC